MGKLEGLNSDDLPILSKRIEELYNHQTHLFSVTLPSEVE